MSLAKAMPSGPEHRGAVAWDLAAVTMILLAYFTRVIPTNGRDLAVLGFLVMVGALVVSAAICVYLISLRPETLRPALLVVLTATVLYMESGFPLPGAFVVGLADLSSNAMVLVVRLIIYVIPIAIFFWFTRERLSVILTLVFGAIAAVGLFVQ